MPPKLKCWTKEADDGHKYTTCNGNQKKKKAPAKAKAKAPAKAPAPPRVVKKGFGIKRLPKKAPAKAKAQAPRVVKKGFGIKRLPKKAPAEAKKKDLNKLSPLELFGMLPQELRKIILTPKETGIKVGVIPVSSFTYDDIVEPDDDDNNLVYEAEENFEESGARDISWIKGITSKQAEFYKNHIYDWGDLSEKKQDRLETIGEKVNDGLRPTIERDMKKELKEWKVKNKGKKMNLKEARLSFRDFSEYF